MATIIEMIPSEPEHRLQFKATNPSGPHVTISGFGNPVAAGETDDNFVEYDVHVLVGPFWAGNDPMTVVPFVTITAYNNSNADEDDEKGWSIQADQCTTGNTFTQSGWTAR